MATITTMITTITTSTDGGRRPAPPNGERPGQGFGAWVDGVDEVDPVDISIRTI